jgi:hypothetical protein
MAGLCDLGGDQWALWENRYGKNKTSAGAIEHVICDLRKGNAAQDSLINELAVAIE